MLKSACYPDDHGSLVPSTQRLWLLIACLFIHHIRYSSLPICPLLQASIEPPGPYYGLQWIACIALILQDATSRPSGGPHVDLIALPRTGVYMYHQISAILQFDVHDEGRPLTRPGLQHVRAAMIEASEKKGESAPLPIPFRLSSCIEFTD